MRSIAPLALMLALALTAHTAPPLHLQPATRHTTSATTAYDGKFWRGVVTTHTHRKPPKTYIEKDPLTGAYYEVTEHAVIHRHRHKRLTEVPTQCNCVVDRTPNNSRCYMYKSKGSALCTSRPCRNRHICVSRNTGMVCIKRKVTRKTVPAPGAPGYCREAPAAGYIYVPYTSY